MSCCIIGCENEGPSASKDTTYHLFPHPEKGLSQFVSLQMEILISSFYFRQNEISSMACRL